MTNFAACCQHASRSSTERTTQQTEGITPNQTPQERPPRNTPNLTQQQQRMAPTAHEFPELESFFKTDATLDEFGDGKILYAKRVSLGDFHSMAQIGIVAHIHASAPQ